MLFNNQQTATPLLPKSRYQDFVNLYQQVKVDGLESQTFNKLFKALCESEVIYPFNWMDTTPARAAWSNPDFNFNNLSLLERSQHLAAIFRADRYEEGVVVSAFNNGLFEKIFNSMALQVQTLQN